MLQSRLPPPLGPLPVVGTSNDGVLPLDLLYEVLLLLPAKPLCRFRAVCTSWRSLLCHGDFIAAHQHRHPRQSLAVGTCGYGAFPVVVITDMDSGSVVKRVSAESASQHHHRSPPPHKRKRKRLSVSRPDRAVCVLGMDMRPILMDFATGAISRLPDHAPPQDYTTTVSYTLGPAAATGEYKLLAIATLLKHRRQVCNILTLGSSGQLRWRGTGSPPCRVVSPPMPSYNRESTVAAGVAYFLVFGSAVWHHPELDVEHEWIMAFNLDSEAWRPAPIRGPTDSCGIGLGGLDGHLVACHDDRDTCVKLWYLVDPDHELWSMLHKIVMPYHKHPSPSSLSPAHHLEYFEKPLAVLDDGRIVVWMRVPASPDSIANLVTVLRVYDPRTRAFSDGTRVANCHDIGVRTMSILYFGRGFAVN